MPKLTLTDLANLSNETSVVTTINANNAAIRAALDTLVSRDGTAPSTLTASLDANSQKIINLPAATSPTEPVRKQEFDAIPAIASSVALNQAVIDAQAAAAAAAASYDNFDDRYLGSKASAPTLDNDGNALTNGALYHNSTDGFLYYRSAGSWVSISSAVPAANSITNGMLNQVATKTLKGRNTASTGNVEDVTVTQVLDWTAGAAVATGDIPFRNASTWDRLPAGTNGYVLKSNGPGAAPSWIAATTAGTAGSTSDVTNETASDLYIRTDRLVNSQRVAKAWCSWNTSGTTTIQDSFNVSSLTDLGTGYTAINFTNAMANANYAAVTSCKEAGGGRLMAASIVSKSAGAVAVYTFQASQDAGFDSTLNNLIVFGD